MPLEIAGVDLAEPLLVGRKILVVIDRVDRALLQTCPAVDTRLRVDVEHLGTDELPRFPAGRMQSTGHTGTQLASLQQFCVIT